MKLYVIPKGTPVTLIDNQGNRKQMVAKTEVSFSDYIIDPISEYNKNKRTITYAQYRLTPNMLSEENKKFRIVEVDFNFVEVL